MPHDPKRHRFAIFLILLTAMAASLPAVPAIVPPPKQADWSGEHVDVEAFHFDLDLDVGTNEARVLARMALRADISDDQDGLPLRIEVGGVEIPEGTSPHHGKIEEQAYRIDITPDGILMAGNSAAAVYHALQTFEQLLDGRRLPVGSVLDWPDIPLRMLMVDPARQNENMGYYRRVVDFAARYKINAIMIHLTDDQTSALYHEDYPELMHHRAWRPEELRGLVAYAAERHIELIPEIESLGHSRMFERLPNFEEYLHQTADDNPDESWMGTDIPGYTNVLCPASPQAVEYLQQMYARSAEIFNHPWVHVGFDEVDMTHCERCIAAYGEQSYDEWMTTALQQANDLVTGQGRRTALWGDMLLSHPEVADAISPDDYVIFDWYYRPDVTEESVQFFTGRGFEVIASPALACAPHMILPDGRNYDNIAAFSRIARENNLPGVNTTIWVPVRYMSDVLWTGIAYAAAHSWGGSNLDEAEFFTGFMEDYFGSSEGAAFHDAWGRLADVGWYRPDIYAGSWIDDASLESARTAAEAREEEVRGKIRTVREVRRDLARLREGITQHEVEWRVLEDSAATLQYTMEHMLAARELDGNPDLLRELSAECQRLIAIIEADWDRNRFADDPGKEGRFLANQHLLYRFKQMDAYHRELLGRVE